MGSINHTRAAVSLCLLGVLLTVGCAPPISKLEPGDTEFESVQGDWYGGMGALAPTNDEQRDQGAPGEAPTEGADEAVREIEEADLAKQVGDYLYILNEYRGFRVVDVSDWSSPKLLGKAEVLGTPLEMYVVDGLAVVVSSDWPRCRLTATGEAEHVGGSHVYALSLADPDHVAVLDRFDFEGQIAETRRVGQVVYIAGYRDGWAGWGYAEPAPLGDAAVSSAQVNADTTGANDGFVASVNIADPNDVQLVDQVEFPATASYIHATTDAVFVAGYSWQTDRTKIVYVDISDPAGAIVVRSSGAVPGYILNRFSLDAYDGVLRVVTEAWPQWQPGQNWEDFSGPAVRLYTFDISNPDEVTSLAELPIVSGETVRAVRFAGPTGYVVTFEQIDPLWVIDLRDGAAPAITGHLEVPGYSTHLVPDGDRLVAMGVDAGETWRPSVALYDVADPENPSQLSVATLGDGWSSSEANYDDKAFKVLPEAKLVLVPVDTWDDSGSVNELRMLDYAEDELEELATIEHRGSAIRSGVDLEDAALWILSRQALQTLDIADRTAPESLATISLAENVLRYKVVGDYGLRLVGNGDYWYGAGGLELQVVRADQPEAGEVLASAPLEVFGGCLSLLDDERAVVSGSDGEGKTRLAVLDLTALPELKVLDERTFDFYSTGGYYYGGYGGYPAAEDAAAKSSVDMVSPWGGYGEPLVLENGALVFQSYDWSEQDYGGSVLKIVTISDAGKAALAATVELGGSSSATRINEVVGVMASGDAVYVSSVEVSFGLVPWLAPPRLKYYLREVDCSDPVRPAMGRAVNVPGILVGVDGEYLFTLDMYLGRNYETQWRFCSLKRDGSKAVLQEAIDLPEAGWVDARCRNGMALLSLEGRGYYASNGAESEDDRCGWDKGVWMSIDIRDGRDIEVVSELELSPAPSVVGLSDAYAIGQVNSWDGQLVLLRIGEDKSLTLEGVTDVKGQVQDIWLRDGAMDVACGYGGVVTVELAGQ